MEIDFRWFLRRNYVFNLKNKLLGDCGGFDDVICWVLGKEIKQKTSVVETMMLRGTRWITKKEWVIIMWWVN